MTEAQLEEYKKIISAELPEIPQNNILYEPSPMNTAPAIYFASKYVELINSKEIEKSEI